MADFDKEIDEIFKSRFDGLKDSSIDPIVHWPAIEQGLAHGLTGSAATSGGASILISKIAAVLSIGLFIAGVSGDSLTQSDQLSSTINKIEVSTASESSKLETQEASYQLKFQNLNTIEEQTISTVAIASFQEAKDVSQEVSSSFANNEIEHLDIATKEESDVFNSISTFSNERRGDFIDNMESLPVYSYLQPIITDPNEIPDPNIDLWEDNHVWFFRGGARIGNGESNSYAMNSEWKVNPTFSFGYGFSLTDQSFISAEIGLLRRSGNAIERMRQRNVDPVVASFANTANKESSFEIHNGLVASQMDYIHIPVMYNRVFSKNWTASIGGFADYLIAAKNHSVIVYNGHEYVENEAKSEEIRSLAGLSKIRYGAVAGIERNLSRHFSAFAQVMVPINNAVDPKSEFEVFGNANRLIDSKVGLKYNF